MPHTHPLFVRFAQKLIVDEEAFEWMTHGDDFCFRPQSAPLDRVWVLPGRSDFASLLALEIPISQVQPYIPASLKIAKAYRGRTFWRFWPLDEGEDLLIRPRFALLRTATGQSAQFTLPQSFRCEFADEATITAWLNAMNARDSDLNAARRWLQLMTPQKLAQLVEVQGGNWDEVAALIQAAFALWARPDSRFELNFTALGTIWLKRSHFWQTPPDPIDYALETLSLHWSLQRVNLQDVQRYWRDCDQFGDPMDVPQPKFAYSETSGHERLEALLLWRDWLCDKAMSPDFETLWRATAI